MIELTTAYRRKAFCEGYNSAPGSHCKHRRNNVAWKCWMQGRWNAVAGQPLSDELVNSLGGKGN